MSEEVFVRTEADVLTLHIVERLGERQRKLEAMAAWERSTRLIALRPMFAVLAVAACLAIAFVVVAPWKTALSPWEELGLEIPSTENFRTATPDLAEIQQLIAAQNYDAALFKTEQALQQSDRELNILTDALVGNDDEMLLYEEELEQLNNSQLRWTYIYLLVQSEEYAVSRMELKKYLKWRDCPHRNEAKALLKKLK